MKYQFEVWHQRGDELVGTYFTCDQFNIYPEGVGRALQIQLVRGEEVYETYWFERVLEYHWGPADPVIP